jgi:acyl-CoA synthetase (AMP-forming)/AMP-acid ligase II
MSPAKLTDCVRALPGPHQVTASLTAADLLARVSRGADALRRQGITPGEAIGLALPNGDSWIVACLSLLEAGARPLLMAPETPGPERDRLLAKATGTRLVTCSGGEVADLGLSGNPGLTDDLGPGGSVRPAVAGTVLLATSGSTGQPALVLRDEASLLAEAERYRRLLDLDGTDQLLLPLPLCHAYALGWLAAALATGTAVEALQPTALGAITTRMLGGATVVALAPALARLLAARRVKRGDRAKAPDLRMAMVGAGPVDQGLEETFRTAFGLPTARNYGSTETGALFAGLPGTAGLPPLGIGRPMPGVDFKIIGGHGRRCAPGEPGALKIRLGATEAWRDTKDLALEADGQVLIMGRRQQAIRRGARWVAPLEVEAALREHPLVRDAHVRARPGGADGDDIMIADVEATDSRRLSSADLAAFARTRLALHKVPTQIRINEQLDRTPAGKIVSPRVYRLAGTGALQEAARAYRRSELLFALADLGALESLENGASADDLAASLGVSSREIEWLLQVAANLGLLSIADDRDPAAGGNGRPRVAGEPAAFIELEAILSGTWLHRTAIADVVRTGIAGRGFDTGPAQARLVAAYSLAMHDAAAAQRTALCLRLTKHLARKRIVEVSAGPGRYLDRLLAADPSATGWLVQLGSLAGEPSQTVREAVAQGRAVVCGEPPSHDFDLCVVANGIHGPHPGSDLGWLADRLRPAGVLVVDDVFLPADGGPGSELGLDWLTHGGIAWRTAASLEAGLTAAGWQVTLQRRLGTSHCHVLLASGG